MIALYIFFILILILYEFHFLFQMHVHSSAAEKVAIAGTGKELFFSTMLKGEDLNSPIPST